MVAISEDVSSTVLLRIFDMTNPMPNQKEIFELVFDATSDESIDELNKLTPFLLTYYMKHSKTNQENTDINNIILRSNTPTQNGTIYVNSFYYDPIKNNHPDIEPLKKAIESSSLNSIREILRVHLISGDNDIRRIASLILEHQIITILKKPVFGAFIMVQNAIGKMLNGESLLDRIKFQIFVEILKGDKIYYNEQVIETDKIEFLQNPMSLVEHNSIDNHGIRSADGSGITFHEQLFGPFSKLV